MWMPSLHKFKSVYAKAIAYTAYTVATLVIKLQQTQSQNTIWYAEKKTF